MAYISCEALSIGYEGIRLQENLNFSVQAGDYLCILGENGTGKSTLMKTLLGLRAPQGGRVVYGDGLKQKEIGYLPQQTLVQRDFPASVKEIVLSGCCGHCSLRPYYNKEEKLRAADAMEKMQIQELSGRCYRELSGGQQQRVLLARALCATEKILLLDEPVSGLDPKAAKTMYQLVEDLNRRDNIAILMISHDPKTALSYASHILKLGANSFFGTRQAYQNTLQQKEQGANHA